MTQYESCICAVRMLESWTHNDLVALYDCMIAGIIGSGYGFVIDGTKLLPEAMLTYCDWFYQKLT